MKRFLLSICALAMVLSASAIKVYVNPGHGSWGSNCRPMATINYAAGDTLGFFESNTNLWKAFALEEKLKAAGFDVKMSRRASGGSGTNEYNKALSTICSEAENYGADYFISIHSNAGPDGSNGSFANYPVILYRGYTGQPKVAKSDAMAKKCMARLYEIFYTTKYDPTSGGPEFTTYYSPSNPDILGDLSFYETSSTYGYLGALKHEIPGFLSEGYFHTYSPARHRALNPDWCRQEGIRYYRGIMDYYSKPKEDVGYIMGYVRSKTETFSHTHYIPHSKSYDVYKPINGAKIVLRNAAGEVIKTNCYPYVARMLKNQEYYTTDHNYNGIFVFDNLTPGTYTISVHAKGYKDYTQTVTVTADATTYPQIFMESGQGTDPSIETDIRWVLNGGIVPGGDVPTNAALWEIFKSDFNSYYGINRANQAITAVSTFWPSGIDSDNDNILTNANSKYKWLGDYIQSIAGTPNGELWWRTNLHAFFNCSANYTLGGVAAADFSQAGKPEAWGEAYQIATGTSAHLPTAVKETYTLPTPKKDGDVFIGWYNNPRGQGSKITSIPAGYKGTLYAIWQYENPDSDKEINIVTWVLNGGIVLGGEVPTNEQLWVAFMDGFNSYYTGYSNASGTFKTRTTRPITEVLEFTWTNIGALGLDFMTDSKSPWKWLGDYILSVAAVQGISISTDSEWRQQFYAFFNCTNVSKKADGTTVGSTIDFTQAGKPEAWGDTYRIAYKITGELPTTIEEPYTLPTPIKEGYIFVGWFDNPEGTGTPLTVLPKGYVGTVYAIWKSATGTHVENLSTPLDLSAPMYDLLGRPVNRTYRGIVIQNGQTYLLR
ncbi:MAG: N-acetylmuramoyl-L-alanine amidase [Paludibacteraceae bacterium]|nr:N-acetylmuramoyl-L-alanine amidase [Paludibacteraceae bacterium]